jgi:hypothetical protein
MWVGCLAGALDENEYRNKLAAAGFVDIELEPTRIFDARQALASLKEKGADIDSAADQAEGKFMSAFIRARKSVGSR